MQPREAAEEARPCSHTAPYLAFLQESPVAQ